MKRSIFYHICASIIVIGCNSRMKEEASQAQNQNITEIEDTLSNSKVFLLDHCENKNYMATLETDMYNSKDTCILNIRTHDHEIIKIETLNIPSNISGIRYCEKEYVIVGFACGGPCYAYEFVFLDARKTMPFDYCQRISNNNNMIAYIENEAFDTLRIHNLKNGKELNIDISDNNSITYGQMDTLFMSKNNLNIRYGTKDGQYRAQKVSLSKIM